MGGAWPQKSNLNREVISLRCLENFGLTYRLDLSLGSLRSSPQTKDERMMKLRNLTPHTVAIYSDKNVEIMSIPSEGSIRMNEYTEHLPQINGIDIIRKSYNGVTLPEPQDGVCLIVSSFVLQYGPRRPDLLCPDTGRDSVIRDENNQIIGVRRLISQ